MKKRRSEEQFPIGTVAFYGPDDKRATKVAVGIVTRPDSDPVVMKRWVSATTDIRENLKVADEIEAFLKEHGVKRIATAPVVIGCPHEEGLDYPEGEKCPFCPFWRNRNRFTHEIEPTSELPHDRTSDV